MEVLLGALADAIFALLLEDIAQRPRLAGLREKLRGDAPEKLALHHALAKTYRAFAEQYAQLAQAFFDEPFLQKPAVVAELTKLLTPDQTADPQRLLQLWREQFYSAPQTDAVGPAITFFLATLTSEIKSQPALKPFIDSRAFDQLYRIAEHGGAQVEQQRQTNALLDEIRRLLAETTTRLASEPSTVHIQTAGGGVVVGNVNTGGGDFVGHDQTLQVLDIRPQPTATDRVAAPPPNPFTDRGRLKDLSRFYVRQPLVSNVQQALRNGNSIALIGPSEAGKSSLLYYLEQSSHEWLADYTSVYLDLQGIIDEFDFCTAILQKLAPVQSKPPRNTKEALRLLRHTLQARKVLLLLDQVEQLQIRLGGDLKDLLRAWCQETGLTLLVACLHPLDKVFPQSSTTSPFHNLFATVEIPNFRADEARTFLRSRLVALPPGFTFTDAEVEVLIEQSQGHAGRLQRAAEALFNHKARQA